MEYEERLKSALADRYRIKREIGSGGMATVYLAQDLKHDRQVAVKVLRPELATSLGTERFLAEIRLTARLQHPHIVPLFDSGEADAFLYYVMPYIEGESLRAQLEREQRLDVPWMLAIARPVAQALAAAHEVGVVHRDIKPENILLSRGHPFVTDFGIARAVSIAGGERLTATGVSVGTPAYMSPEQVLGEESIDERSDVYSLGCVIYEMLSGTPPFTGATVQALLAKRLAGPPPHLMNVPGPVDEVVRRSLATAPQDRFASALALADALVEAARRPSADERSIVVLPFDNLSPDPDNAFFADGLTEELIADLSKVQALRVISRTSAQRYRDTDKSLPDIASELGVKYVMEGSVRRAGDSLRITAQLIEAATDSHLWAEKYTGTLEDVFDMQERVSQAIVQALQVRLSTREQSQLRHRAIPDAEVYADWLKARQLVRNVTTSGLSEAADRLEAGLRRIGDNAVVMAGLALVHWHQGMLGANQDEQIKRSVEWAERALEVDPGVAQAHVILGLVQLLEGDPQGALRHFRSAHASDPGDWETQQWMAYLYCGVGHHEKALVHARALKALDPAEPLGDIWESWVHLYDGRREEAAAIMRKVPIERDNPHRLLGFAQMEAWQGNRQEALDFLDSVEPLDSYDYMVQMCFIYKDALLGDRAAFERHLTPDLVRSVEADAWGAHMVAELYCLLGDSESALRWLDRAASWGWLNYPLYAHTDPLLEPLRGDPRFQIFLERVKKQWEEFEV